jgi:beta-N-acetylhexosaminidase
MIDRSRDSLEREELAVFRSFATGENRVDSMMIGHAFYPALDATRTPSSLSKEVVTKLLRADLGFDGLIMTDDLDMGAILEERTFEQTILEALQAGNDLLMICHRIEMVAMAANLLEKAPTNELDRALENVHHFRKQFQPPLPFSLSDFETADREVWKLRVEVLGEEMAALRSPEDGKRSPVELY